MINGGVTYGIVLSALLAAATAHAQDAAAAEQRIGELLRQMTLEEKVSLVSGTGFESRAIPRLGIPPLTMTDGPVGVRWGRSTAFPASIALAAAWDTSLARKYGQALGREAKAKNRWMLLGPCININRVPHGGRNFESFGEDPFLTSRVAVGYITGVQSEHVAACTKHYAANNQEWKRESISAEVDERTIREIYFPAFRAAVEEAGTWGVMSAYNKVNGTWCSENPFLLTDVLKHEWGFKGMVVSDWGAVHSTVPTANAGLDIEMPDGRYLGGTRLLDAVRSGEVRQADIDDKVRRILRTISFTGLLDPQVPTDTTVVNSPAHRQFARDVAAAGTVLLKNTGGLLPLDPSRLKSIAVIGPNAAWARTGGGSSHVSPFSSVTPLEGVKARAGKGIAVTYAQGCVMEGDVVPVESRWLRPAQGSVKERGLRGEYFPNLRLDGPPAFVRTDRTIDFDWGDDAPAADLPKDNFSVRWTGSLVAPATGEIRLSVRSDDGVRLFVNGSLLIDDWKDHASETKSAVIRLEQGNSYELKLEYYENGGGANIRFGWMTLANRLMEEAVAAARGADVALVFAGTSDAIETEGADRVSIDMPEGQDALIDAVITANPRTIVVLMTGAPVLMPWAGKIPAIVESWFGGQEAGGAIADVLFGDAVPSGKLPVTFPTSWKDCPAFPTYPESDGKTSYAEGIFVGYRHFDKAGITPAFAFGHGLSYTTFSYGPLSVVPAGNCRFVATLEITNSGGRPAAEVVQLYVSDPAASVPRPPRELKAFAKVFLAPGEKKAVTMLLGDSAFTFFDPASRRWVLEPGKFELQAGSSSRDIRSTASIEIP